MLAIIQTHPVQYHAPVWRHLQQVCGVPVTAIYGSDFSVTGYRDTEFNASFAWDTDLLSGYNPVFLSRIAEGGAGNEHEVTTRGLGEALRRVQPRAILSVGYWPRFHMNAFRCARRGGQPMLFRGETTDHARTRGGVKRLFRDVTLCWFYRQFAALIYVGGRSRQHFQRLGVGARANYFSPYCVDTTPLRPEEGARQEVRAPTRLELGITPDQLVVAFVGKLSPRKAPDLILAAVRQLAPPLRDRVVILLVGDGELADSLKRAAAVEPVVSVRHVGFQNQRALSRYYHAADLMVLPSVQGETWGLVVNEALHHGLPVVVSDAVGCAPDLVEPGKTGEVCQATSAPALGEAIGRAAVWVSRPETRDRCREKVEGYTIARAAEGIAKAYRAVTGDVATETAGESGGERK